MFDSQPVTISVVLHSWCSEALHRTMLVWLLHDQSDMCFINFVTESKVHQMESKVHQMLWFKSNKYCFLNQFKILVCFNLVKSPPWKQKSPPNFVNHKIAPWGDFAHVEDHWFTACATHFLSGKCNSLTHKLWAMTSGGSATYILIFFILLLTNTKIKVNTCCGHFLKATRNRRF